MNISLAKRDVTSNNKWERIWLLAKIEFKLRYNENKLGLLWALIKPLFQLAIYYIAFKIIIRNNVPNFAIYLFGGLIIFQFFLESTIGLIKILKTKKYLYEYSNMSKIEIYLASLISISLGFFFNTLVYILILVFADIDIGFNAFYAPLIFILLFCISLGVGMILSNIFILIKDINQLWPLFSQLFMWSSPIFFASEVLKSRLDFIDVVNPLFGIITNFRGALMYNTSPDFRLLAINTIQAILFLGIGFILLKKVGNKASEKL